MIGGFFITLEGGEGTGKSTQAKRLAEALRAIGREVLQSREPGGTPQGEKLRELLVNGPVDQWTPEAEAMLNAAARAIHVRDVIQPNLDAGHVVISDRFMDSTRAYQGFAGGCDPLLIDALERAAVAAAVPNLTLVFDLDPDIGLARAKARGAGQEDRFERKGLAFHHKLRQGFLDIALKNSHRCKVIDASLPYDAVFAQCWESVKSHLHG